MRTLLLAVAIVAATPLFGCRKHRYVPATRARTGIEGTAERFVRALTRGRYREARRDFDEKMARAMPAPSLEAAWRSLGDRAGRFQSIANLHVEPPRDGYRAVIVTTRHARMAIDVRVVFDDRDRIAGLWFAPASVEWRAPAYVKSDAFVESEVLVNELPGTLTLPHAPRPARAVVLVHGSGPNDRDETLGGTKVFKDLAQGLASRGIAALRYEKRSKHAPQTLVGRAIDQDDEVTFDARAAVRLLAARPEIDAKHVVVLGHSQGASMAPRIARGEPGVAAIALLAGSTRPFDKLLIDQWRYLLSVQGVPAEEAAQKIEAIRDALRRVRSEGPDAEEIEVAGVRAPRRYYRDLLDERSAEIARELSIPMFIAHGGRDYQVTMEDFAGYQKALTGRSDVTFRAYPTLNHHFVAGEGPSTPGEYQWPAHVDAALLDDLVRFITSLP